MTDEWPGTVAGGDAGGWPGTIVGGTKPSNPEAPKPVSALEAATRPITSYPSTYMDMNREAREQMGHGVQQATGTDSSLWDRAKGVGNVAAGSLGYVTSPLAAGLRTIAGKPVEDATGIPKEYTEFAASLALPMPKVAPKAPIAAPRALTKTEEIASAADRLGVDMPKAAVTDNLIAQRTAGALKEIPIVGDPLVKAARSASEGLGAARDRTVAGYGSGSIYGAGSGAKDAMKNWITTDSKTFLNGLYGDVDALVNPTVTRDLSATRSMIADIARKRQQAALPGGGKAVDVVLPGVQRPGGLTYEGVKDLRTRVGEMLDTGILPEGMSGAELKRIYGALTDDLRSTVSAAGGPQATTAFNRANTAAEVVARRREALAKIIGEKADVAPEQVMDRLVQMGSTNSRANIDKLLLARQTMGPSAWDEVASAAINRMGNKDALSDFSPDRFLTAYGKMSESAKDAMFGSKPDLKQSLDDIARLSERFSQLQKLGNPSGTARTGAVFTMGAGLVAAPLQTIATAVGGNIAARMLASPVTAKAAAQWTQAYVAASTAPSRQAIIRLTAASRGLALASERNFGTDGASVMSALMPSQPAAAPGKADGGEVKGYKHLPLSHNIEDRRGSYEDHALGHQYGPDSDERLRPGRIAGNAARRFDSKGRAEADQAWRDDPVNANALALRHRGGPVRRYAEGGNVDELIPPPRNPAHPINPDSPTGKAVGQLFAHPVQLALDAIKAPRRALDGYYSGMPNDYGAPEGEKEVRDALWQHGMTAADMPMSGAIPFAPRGAVGVMGGRLPRT